MTVSNRFPVTIGTVRPMSPLAMPAKNTLVSSPLQFLSPKETRSFAVTDLVGNGRRKPRRFGRPPRAGLHRAPAKWNSAPAPRQAARQAGGGQRASGARQTRAFH